MSELSLSNLLLNKRDVLVARNAARLCGKALVALGVMPPEYADTIAGMLELAARIQRQEKVRNCNDTAKVLDFFAAEIRKQGEKH